MNGRLTPNDNENHLYTENHDISIYSIYTYEYGM